MAKKSAALAKSTPTSKPKTPFSNSHPPYLEMITDAISTLRDRTGSSQQAISKLIENKHKNALPNNFKKFLSVQLKRFVESGRLIKVKKSYKLPSIHNFKEVDPKKTITKPKDKQLSDGQKVKKTRRLSQVKAPEASKRKDEKKTAASVSGKKMKRLSQVKTPESMKKKKKMKARN